MVEKHIGGSESKEIFYAELEQFAREKIRGHLQDLLEQEVSEWLGREKSERKVNADEQPGYRNGYGRPRRLAMSLGTIEIERPRVRDLSERFKSKVLPMFKRQTQEVRDLIQRLKEKWQNEYTQWTNAPIEQGRWAYLWADGIYVKAGLGKEKTALLVVIGVKSDGSKCFLALEAGYRESKESWAGVLRQLKGRGLKQPRLFVGDGNLGLWAAVSEVYPQAQQQLCWNHKMLNVIDTVSRKEQSQVKRHLQAMMYAENREQALAERKKFEQAFRHSPKTIKTVVENWERLTTYYDYPREHWKHLRTSNVVESPFSRVRLRTAASRRFKSQLNATCLIWKTLMVAEMSFRKLNVPHLVDKVARGMKCNNGAEVRDAA